MGSLINAALQFARDGYEIFPAPPNEKKSYKSAGKSNGHRWGSTSDPDVIRVDWKKWPTANIGLPTGTINKVWVLDADTVEGHGVDGISNLKALERQHGRLPKTLGAVSPTGSKHWYFKYPDDGREIRGGAGIVAPGVDVQGEGNMVIAPPSTGKGGRAYRWVNRGIGIAEAPKWLLDLVCGRARHVAKKPHTNGASDDNPFAVYGSSVAFKPLTTEELNAAVAVIPNTEKTTRKVWVRVGMAIKGAAPNEDGRKAWHAHSEKWPGAINGKGEHKDYDYDDTEKRWWGFRPKEIGAGTLIYLAEQSDPLWRGFAKPTINDFYAYNPTNKFIYTPARDFWVLPGVNARLGKVPVEGKKSILASAWITQNKSVEQVTWAPGLPMVIENKIMQEGGWISHKGSKCFNFYRAPIIIPGDPTKARPWLDHVKKLYPNDWQHIVKWCAQRLQHPEIKLNHALVLMGGQGIGKDTLLEPVRRGVGPWNFREISPEGALSKFNIFARSVILRINETRDLGESTKYKFYDHLKNYIAAPPETIAIEEKGKDKYAIPNLVGVVMTSNYRDSVYLKPDDRRHYPAWSDATQRDFTQKYFVDLYNWINGGGDAHVAAYLRSVDLKDFDPAAPPPQTDLFREIVSFGSSPQVTQIRDVIEEMGDPKMFTIDMLMSNTGNHGNLSGWLDDSKNALAVVRAFLDCGYSKYPNPAAKSERWRVGRKRPRYT